MPRLNMIEPKTDTGPGADLLNGPLKAKQINIFKGLANNPGVLSAFLGFAGGVKAGALSPAEHEIVALVAAEQNHCEYCLAAHSQVAQGAGFDENAVLDIRRGTVNDAKQQVLIDFVLAVMETRGFVSDDQLATFKNAGFGDDAVIEVIGAIAVNTFTNLFNHVNETEIDFPIPASV